jgi:hypothetical protein
MIWDPMGQRVVLHGGEDAPRARTWTLRFDSDPPAWEPMLVPDTSSVGPATIGQVGSEQSPYGMRLGVTYPKPDIDGLMAAVEAAEASWRKAGPEAWVGVSLEILDRINKASFDMKAFKELDTFLQATKVPNNTPGGGALRAKIDARIDMTKGTDVEAELMNNPMWLQLAGVTVLIANGPASQSSSTQGSLPFKPNRCSG